MAGEDDDVTAEPRPIEPAFAGRIAHDLNNVFTIIDANLYYIAQREQSPAELENLEDLRVAIARGKALVAQLLEASGRR